MISTLHRPVALLQILLVLFAAGCAPTQPFFLHEDGDLSHYIDAATAIEYPDVEVQSLQDVLQTREPLTLNNMADVEYWDVTLEECVAMALQNSKILRTVGGTAEQRQSVAAQILSGNAETIGSVFDPAVQMSTTQSFPLTVDSAGNRTLQRGVQRANQVGGVEDALAEFDAQVSGLFSYNNTDRPRNVTTGNPFNPQQFRSWDSTQQLAISKRMATGGIATLRQQIIYSRNNIQAPTIGRAVPSDWTAILEAQVQHPLARNRGTMINRVPVVLASLNEDLSIAEFEVQVRNLVRDVEVAYWDLYAAYRAVDAAKAGRTAAQTTQRFARINMEQGNATAQELKQAEGQYFQFRSQLQSALAGSNVAGNDPFGVQGRERELRFKMGISPSDQRLIRPIDEPVVASVEFDWYEILSESLVRSVELRQQKYRVKQRELELLVAKNQLLPEVNLNLTYRWLGVGDTLGPPDRVGRNFPASGSSALAELTEGDYQEAAVQLEVTPTAIGSRRENARVRNAQLQLKRDIAYLQDQELALVNLLADAYAKVQTHYDQAQTFLQQLAAAETEVRLRMLTYEAGQSDVNEVLQSQATRAQAETNYYRALAEYNKSISYVHYLKGSWMDYYNVTLSEGPWPQKAYWDAVERARERDASYYLNYGWTRPSVVREGTPVHGTGSAIGFDPAMEQMPATMEMHAPAPVGGLQPTLAPPLTPGMESVLVPGDATPETAGAASILRSKYQPVGSGVAPQGSPKPVRNVDSLPDLQPVGAAGKVGNRPAAIVSG